MYHTIEYCSIVVSLSVADRESRVGCTTRDEHACELKGEGGQKFTGGSIFTEISVLGGPYFMGDQILCDRPHIRMGYRHV